jgi:hypothetical protein
LRAYHAVAALVAIALTAPAGTGVAGSPRASDTTASVVGTWRLVLADHRPNKEGPWVHAYGEHPQGYIVYDQTGHMFVQVCNDPPTPPFASGDDYKPTAREAQTAYLNYVAYFGTYSLDPARHVLTHHVEGSLLPSFTATDQERPYILHGDTLELTDSETWRAVWQRVPPPNRSGGVGGSGSGRTHG